MAPPGPPQSRQRRRVDVPASTARSQHNPSPTERLALAQLELERIEAACRFDRCEADYRVRASALASVEAVRLAYWASTGVVA